MKYKIKAYEEWVMHSEFRDGYWDTLGTNRAKSIKYFDLLGARTLIRLIHTSWGENSRKNYKIYDNQSNCR